VRKGVFMVCPQCKCKVTYDCTPDDMQDDYEREKCSACGCVFYSMDAEDEDDYPYDDLNDCPQCKGTGTYWDMPCDGCDATGRLQY